MSWIERSTTGKTIGFLSGVVRHRRLVLKLLLNKDPGLRRLLLKQPQILKIVAKPFLTSHWDGPERVARIINHFDTVSRLGSPILSQPDEVADLVQLTQIGPAYRLTLDQPPWLLFEGPIAFSLWERIDRIFHVSFCLSSEDGRRVAYIGGIQGRGEANVLDRYREFTKAAFGMRPRDFLIEAFRLFCAAIDVTEIRAISDAALPWREIDDAARQLSYDEVWRERGGEPDQDGFYRLSVTSPRRANEEIPSKKRAQYRRRYAALDAISEQIVFAMTRRHSAVKAASQQLHTAHAGRSLRGHL